jgi:hypothetical protein
LGPAGNVIIIKNSAGIVPDFRRKISRFIPRTILALSVLPSESRFHKLLKKPDPDLQRAAEL